MDSYKWETFITKLKNKKKYSHLEKKGKISFDFVPETIGLTLLKIKYVLNGLL